ncbi:MAG TPA: 50S ribosomal protein L25 [Solirubrobacteraceae bacterium]|jgi:large subunit ribosomal protein L25|nr:50S ribosomal protein L25 [Solirubrobacteraceae bacterium]
MASTTTKLSVNSRSAAGSRAARRMRREGRVLGVLYGGGEDPVGFDADARDLRLALAGSGAVLDLSIDGQKATPVVLKEAQRDPVKGHTVHIDLLRVRLDEAITAVVPLELLSVDDSPGVKEGGVLEQITREVNVEALPTAIPESISHDVGEMQIGDTLLLGAIVIPEGVTLLDDLEETVIATLSPPKLQTEADEEIESETEVVGEGSADSGDDSGDSSDEE